MTPTENKQLDDLINETILPALSEDFEVESLEEA